LENTGIDIGRINKIVKKIISQIDSSRSNIYKIVDCVRAEYDKTTDEIEKLKYDIDKVIDEVDNLEKEDKQMRQNLVEVSRNFKIYGENDIKNAYEKAEQTRIKLITKKNEEKSLRDKRYQLEMSLKQIKENIDAGEKIINQVSIALGYLEGDVLSQLEVSDKNTGMTMGIMILEAQENERKRIARDIHDGPAQHMANVVMEADICKKILKNDFDEGINELESLKKSVKLALKEVRSIIFNLRPMSLDDLGLNQTIQEAASTIENEYGIEINLVLKPVKNEIEAIIQVAVYRIIQEIFNNIKKHSMAKHADVKMDYGTKYLRLIINDDGIGFDVNETLKKVKTKGSSYGLLGMIERVNQLQGEIDIKSTIGKGTMYNIKLPISQEVIKDEQKKD
jgi:two-component system sensor histidine kinase DegS